MRSDVGAVAALHWLWTGDGRALDGRNNDAIPMR
jgi:hypothetical protein